MHMEFIMKSIAFPLVAISLATLIGCGPRAVKNSTLRDESGTRPAAPAIAEHTAEGADMSGAIERIRALNIKAGAPSFGVVGGYYQLPQANPAGAVSTSSGSIAGIPYDQTRVEATAARPWALQPTSTATAEMVQGTLAALLEAGVKWREVSMADATRIIEAEKSATGARSIADFNKMVPSGVDLLLSVQQGSGVAGKIVVGRVVRTRDGALLALASQPDVGAVSMRPLLLKLVEQSLERVAAER